MDTESMLNTVNAAMTQCRTARRDRIANSLAPVAIELRTRLDAERRVFRIGEQIRVQSLGANARWASLADQVDQFQAWPPRWVVGAEAVSTAPGPWLEELPQTD